MYTYAELQKIIEKMTEEQKQCNVSVLLADSNEFAPLIGYGINPKEGDLDNFQELDEDHPYLIING